MPPGRRSLPEPPPLPADQTSSSMQQRPTVSGLPRAGMNSGPFRIRGWMKSEVLHDWIRSGGILIAAMWGVYTFVWKDILVPFWAPALLNLEVSLTSVERRQNSPGGEEMTLEIKATNPSTHKLHLLTSTWWITGLNRARRAKPDDPQVDQNAIEHLKKKDFFQFERAVTTQLGKLLATGQIFGDDQIEAGETIRRTFLVHIPRGSQDYAGVEVQANVVSLFREPSNHLFDGRRLVLAPGTNSFQLLLCNDSKSTVNSSGETIPVCTDTDPQSVDRVLRRFDSRFKISQLSEQVGLPPSAPAAP